MCKVCPGSKELQNGTQNFMDDLELQIEREYIEELERQDEAELAYFERLAQEAAIENRLGPPIAPECCKQCGQLLPEYRLRLELDTSTTRGDKQR